MAHAYVHAIRLLTVTAVVAFAACGSDSKSVATTSTLATTVPATVASSTTSTAATVTTLTSSEQPTTTAVPAEPVMPLTGLAITDPQAAVRQAVVVKIDNHPDARPQSGLGVADLVFEENVEQLTRFAAVFQTTVPDPIGPVRSGRTQDVLMLGSLDKPMFAWSGGNAQVTAAIESSDFFVVRVDANKYSKSAGTFRAKDRGAPHNLYTKGSGLLSLSPAGSPPPPQQFRYLPAGAARPGDVSTGVQVAMDGVNVRWTYDDASGGYLRDEDGKPHIDRESGRINAANVVVLTVDYQPSPADGRSPEAQTIGSGEAAVYTGGKVVTGTWTRDTRQQPFTLKDPSGAPLLLTPGRTWVELARPGTATQL